MKKNDVGYWGEQVAVMYLIENGYKIRDRNFVYNKKEIDIIAQDGMTIIFVEVKQRQPNSMFSGLYAVNTLKKRHIRYVARNYLGTMLKAGYNARFDVVEVIMRQGEYKPEDIKHYKGIF